MDSPHIKSSCGTQNENSNPMGIGFGIDYVTWRKILKWIVSHMKFDVGHKTKIPILWVIHFTWRKSFPPCDINSNPMGIGLELTMSHGGKS